MKSIVSGIYQFTGLKSGQVYLIEDVDGLTMIDTGMQNSVAGIVEQLTQRGYDPSQVKRILITHAHIDHVGGLPTLKELTGAMVIASAAEKPVIEGLELMQQPPRESLSGLAKLVYRPSQLLSGTPVDCVVQDGDVIPEVGDGLTVINVPGHTPGHLAFWLPQKGVLFCGDIILNVFGLRLPVSAFTVNMEDNVRAIKRLSMLKPSVICLGHGKPITRNAAGILDRFAQKVGAI